MRQHDALPLFEHCGETLDGNAFLGDLQIVVEDRRDDTFEGAERRGERSVPDHPDLIGVGPQQRIAHTVGDHGCDRNQQHDGENLPALPCGERPAPGHGVEGPDTLDDEAGTATNHAAIRIRPGTMRATKPRASPSAIASDKPATGSVRIKPVVKDAPRRKGAPGMIWYGVEDHPLAQGSAHE